jgi:hypothetical protein
LTDDEITQVTDKMREILKTPASAPVPPEQPSSNPINILNRLKDGKTGFYWGLAAGVGLFLAAPLFRPVVRGAVKGSLRLGRYAKEVASLAKEELEDIAAEAKAETKLKNRPS